MIESRDKMININDNEVKNIAECNLLHNIINTSKGAKNINSHYYPILHGYMDTRKGRAKLKIFRVLLDIGCSSTIVMIRLAEKLRLERYAVMQWQTQDGNITTNFKVKVDFTLTTLIPNNVVIWKYHLDDSARGRYDIILGRDLLTELGLNPNFLNTSSEQMTDLL